MPYSSCHRACSWLDTRAFYLMVPRSSRRWEPTRLSSKFRHRSRKCSIRRLGLTILERLGRHSISLKKLILSTRSSRTTAYSTAFTRTTGVSQGLPTRKPTIALSRSILTAPSFTAIPPMSLTWPLRIRKSRRNSGARASSMRKAAITTGSWTQATRSPMHRPGRNPLPVRWATGN